MNLTGNETIPVYLEIPGASRAILSSVLFFVFFIGGSGNSIMSLLVFRHAEMHCIINILLATMAASDAIISIICVPFDIISINLQEWIFGSELCLIHAFLLTTLVVQNVLLLIIISADRYYILVHKQNYLDGYKATILIPGCLVISMIVSCPPIFGYGDFIFINEVCKQSNRQNRDETFYFYSFSSFVFLLPCTILFLAFVRIILAIRKTKHRVRPEFNRVNERQRFAIGKHYFDNRFKQKTFSTIVCLYVVAMTCKLPYVTFLLSQNISQAAVKPMPRWYMVLTYSNSAINPFVYAFKITTYWMVLNGKYGCVRDRVRSLSFSRKRSNPGSIYRVSIDTSTSSLGY